MPAQPGRSDSGSTSGDRTRAHADQENVRGVGDTDEEFEDIEDLEEEDEEEDGSF